MFFTQENKGQSMSTSSLAVFFFAAGGSKPESLHYFLTLCALYSLLLEERKSILTSLSYLLKGDFLLYWSCFLFLEIRCC